MRLSNLIEPYQVAKIRSGVTGVMPQCSEFEALKY